MKLTVHCLKPAALPPALDAQFGNVEDLVPSEASLWLMVDEAYGQMLPFSLQHVQSKRPFLQLLS